MQPNILLIMTDNQGAWTLGCYGNTEIRTPALDRLAADGVRFAEACCVNPVCSPNRATCLTGLMPSQHGVHNWLGTEKPDAQMGPAAYCTIEEFDNLPRFLSSAGYRCSLSGKWHLGDSLRPQLGFTSWFTMPHGHTRTFYNAEAIRDGAVYREPRYFTDAIADHAIDCLRASAEEPFFLYVAFNGPYGLDEDLRAGHRNRHTAYYADKPLRCFPREEVHPWLRGNRDVINNDVAIRGYAAAVSGVDDGVARILATLDDLGLRENTIVIFTADQGFYGGHHGLWGMADHARPLPVFDENLRIPLLWRYPSGIPTGGVSNLPVCTYDLYPTLLDVLALPGGARDAPWGDGLERPGRSYAAALRGDEAVARRPADLPRVREHADGARGRLEVHPPPTERPGRVVPPRRRSRRTRQPDRRSGVCRGAGEMRTRLDAFFARYAQPEYDLWAGGRSKAGRITE